MNDLLEFPSKHVNNKSYVSIALNGSIQLESVTGTGRVNRIIWDKYEANELREFLNRHSGELKD